MCGRAFGIHNNVQNETAALCLCCPLLQPNAQPGHLWKTSMRKVKTIHLPPPIPHCLVNWAVDSKLKDRQIYLGGKFWGVLLNSTAKSTHEHLLPRKINFTKL